MWAKKVRGHRIVLVPVQVEGTPAFEYMGNAIKDCSHPQLCHVTTFGVAVRGVIPAVRVRTFVFRAGTLASLSFKVNRHGVVRFGDVRNACVIAVIVHRTKVPPLHASSMIPIYAVLLDCRVNFIGIHRATARRFSVSVSVNLTYFYIGDSYRLMELASERDVATIRRNNHAATMFSANDRHVNARGRAITKIRSPVVGAKINDRAQKDYDRGRHVTTWSIRSSNQRSNVAINQGDNDYIYLRVRRAIDLHATFRRRIMYVPTRVLSVDVSVLGMFVHLLGLMYHRRVLNGIAERNFRQGLACLSLCSDNRWGFDLRFKELGDSVHVRGVNVAKYPYRLFTVSFLQGRRVHTRFLDSLWAVGRLANLRVLCFVL